MKITQSLRIESTLFVSSFNCFVGQLRSVDYIIRLVEDGSIEYPFPAGDDVQGTVYKKDNG